MIHHRRLCLRMSPSAVCLFSSVCLAMSLYVRPAIAGVTDNADAGQNPSVQQAPPPQQTTPSQQQQQPQQRTPPSQQAPRPQTPAPQGPPNPFQNVPTAPEKPSAPSTQEAKPAAMGPNIIEEV